MNIESENGGLKPSSTLSPQISHLKSPDLSFLLHLPKMLMSVLSTSEVAEEVLSHSAKLWRDCTGCWDIIQIKHNAYPSKWWPCEGERQVNK